MSRTRQTTKRRTVNRCDSLTPWRYASSIGLPVPIWLVNRHIPEARH